MLLPRHILLFLLLPTLALAQSTAPSTASAPASQPAPLRVLAKPFAAPDTAYAPAGTRICAGGIASPIHQARIKISLDLPPGKSDIVKISLVNGGAGGAHPLAAWRWAPPAVQATLRLDAAPGDKPQSISFGDAAPLTLTTTGVLLGTLTSSNAPEFTTISVALPAQGLVATATVQFGDPTLNISFDPSGTQPGIASSGKVSVLFGGAPVDGHLMKLSVSKIHFENSDERKRELGLTEFNATDLSPLMDIGGDARAAFYLTRPDEREHAFVMTQTAHFTGFVEYQADDLSCPDPTPTSANARNAISRQWLRWSDFLNPWQSPNSQSCSFAFAGNNHFPTKLTLAQALQTRGPRTGWTSRIAFPVVKIHDQFPLLLSVTTFWTIPNPDRAGSLPKFHATEELFDIKLLNLTPYIVGYEVKDVTQPQFTAASNFIELMTTRLHDKDLSNSQQIASGVSAAIASAQIADTGRLWDLLQSLHSAGLANYPEQLMQIQGILTGLCKNDPIPPDFKKLSTDLLPK